MGGCYDEDTRRLSAYCDGCDTDFERDQRQSDAGAKKLYADVERSGWRWNDKRSLLLCPDCLAEIDNPVFARTKELWAA